MLVSAEPKLDYISDETFLTDVKKLARLIDASAWRPNFLIGIGRGGLVPAVYISHQLDLPMLSIDHSSRVPGFADELLSKVAAKSASGTRLLFIDDINDSGGTINYICSLLSDGGSSPENLRFAVVINNLTSRGKVDYWAEEIDRDNDKRWFVFPWEAVGTRETIVDEALSVPERLG